MNVFEGMLMCLRVCGVEGLILVYRMCCAEGDAGISRAAVVHVFEHSPLNMNAEFF